MFQPDAHKLKKEFDKIISRYENPEVAIDQIIKKIIDKRARLCGIIGFLTSFGGFITMLITLPLDIYFSTEKESEMIYLLAYAYGYLPDDFILEPLKNYILSETKPKGEALKIGIELEAVTAREVLKQKGGELTSEVIKEIIKEAGTNVIKATRKSTRKTARKMVIKVFTRSIGKLIAKVFPIVGAIIGYWVNSQSAQRTGKLTLNWLNKLEVERQNKKLPQQ